MAVQNPTMIPTRTRKRTGCCSKLAVMRYPRKAPITVPMMRKMDFSAIAPTYWAIMSTKIVKRAQVGSCKRRNRAMNTASTPATPNFMP